MIDTDEIAEVFGGVSLFKRLSAGQRTRLAARATTRAYRPRAVIVRQGDTSMSLYVVLSGKVRIERESEAGGAVPVAEAVRGGFFGEMGLIDDEPRAATVIAEEPTECALLAKWDFQNELRRDPEIALALLPVLSARVRDLDLLLTRGQAAAQTA